MVGSFHGGGKGIQLPVDLFHFVLFTLFLWPTKIVKPWVSEVFNKKRSCMTDFCHKFYSDSTKKLGVEIKMSTCWAWKRIYKKTLYVPGNSAVALSKGWQSDPKNPENWQWLAGNFTMNVSMHFLFEDGSFPAIAMWALCGSSDLGFTGLFLLGTCQLPEWFGKRSYLFESSGMYSFPGCIPRYCGIIPFLKLT